MTTKFSVRAIQQGQTQNTSAVTAGAGQSGQALVLQARAGTKYQLTDILTLTAPAKLKIKRSGQDLLLALPGGDVDMPDIVIKDYFNFTDVSLMGQSGTGQWMIYDTPGVGAAGTTPTGAAANQTATATLDKAPGGSWFDGGLGLGALAAGGLGLAALGGGGGGNAASTTPSASVTKITTYKSVTTAAALTVSDYLDAEISGVTLSNVTAINASIKATVLKVDTKESVQKVVDAFIKISGEANGSTADQTPDADPTATDYANIGVRLILAISNPKILELLNDSLKNLPQSSADTPAKIQALADAVEKLARIAGGITEVLVADDLSKLGIDTTATSLAAITDAIKQSDDTASAINTVAKVKAMVTAYNTILAEANGSAADATPDVNPTASDYAAIGVTGKAVTTTAADHVNALKLLNDIVAVRNLGDVDTVGEIQTFATLAEKIYNLAALTTGATLTTAQTLTAAELTSLGLTGFSSSAANNTALAVKVSEAIRDADPANFLTGLGFRLVNGDKVNDVAQTQLERLQALVSLEVIKNYVVDTTTAANTTVAPTLADWKAAGIFKDHPTDAGKFADIESTDVLYLNSAVDKLTATQITTTGLQTVVNSYVKIIREANGPTADANTNPTATDYAAVGASIGTAANDTNDGRDALARLNAIIGNLNASSVDTLAEIEKLAATLDKIRLVAASEETGDLAEAHKFSAEELKNLGLTVFTVSSNVTQGMVDALATQVSKAIRDKTPGEVVAGTLTGTKLDTSGTKISIDQTQLERLQALVSLEVIKNYVVDTTTAANTTVAPTLADWKAAGIFKDHATDAGKFAEIDSADLAYLNSAVDKLTATPITDIARLQAVVNSYVKIIREANGSAADATPGVDPIASDFVNIGVVASDTDLTVFQKSFLPTLIGEKSSTQVDSILEIQNVLPTITSLLTLAAKGDITSSTAPDDADKTALSVTRLTNDLSLKGVNDSNRDDVLRAIQNTDNSGSAVDTFAELQSLVSLTRILRYADSSSTTNNPGGEPTYLDWTSIIGLNNESEANFRAYNSVVDSYSQTGLSSPGYVAAGSPLAGLQEIVDSFNVILAEADGNKLVDQTTANPLIADYKNLNLSFSSWATLTDATDNAKELNLLNSAVGGMTTDKVDSFGELQAIADAAGRVVLQAQADNGATTSTTSTPGGTFNTTANLSKADLTLLGLDTSKIGNGVGSNDANEFSNILAEIQNMSPSDTFNLATLQTKIDSWALS